MGGVKEYVHEGSMEREGGRGMRGKGGWEKRVGGSGRREEERERGKGRQEDIRRANVHMRLEPLLDKSGTQQREMESGQDQCSGY